MNITLEEEDHSIDTIRAKYKAMLWVQILDVVIRCFIGGVWALVTYSSILGSVKLFKLVYNQYCFNYYKEKWEKEVMLFEDEQCINQTNEKYRKIIVKYYDRLDRYDKGMEIQSSLYRYSFLFIIIFSLNIGCFFVEYMRSCMCYGLGLFIAYQIYQYLDTKYIQPYLQNKALEEEKSRLNVEIAKNKKQN